MSSSPSPGATVEELLNSDEAVTSRNAPSSDGGVEQNKRSDIMQLRYQLTRMHAEAQLVSFDSTQTGR